MRHLANCELKQEKSTQNTPTQHRLDLGKVYKKAADEVGNRIQQGLVQRLNDKRVLKFDMDSMFVEMEAGINKFISVCFHLESIITWSSMLKIDDVDELLMSTKPQDANLVHASILSFY